MKSSTALFAGLPGAFLPGVMFLVSALKPGAWRWLLPKEVDCASILEEVFLGLDSVGDRPSESEFVSPEKSSVCGKEPKWQVFCLKEGTVIRICNLKKGKR